MFPVIAFIIRTIKVRAQRQRDSQQAMGDITQVIEESVTAHKVVKLSAASTMKATVSASRPTGCDATR